MGIKKTLASLLVGAASFGLSEKVSGQYPLRLYNADQGGALNKITDYGDNCVLEETLVVGGTPQDVVINPWSGNPIVAHGAQNGRVVEYDKNNGQIVREYLVPDFVFGLAFSSQSGDLFVGSGLPEIPGEPGYGEVYRFDGQTGNSLGAFVDRQNSGVIDVPHDIEFGLDGNLYVLSPRTPVGIFKYDGDTGELIQPAPLIPVSGLPRWFTITPYGNILLEGSEYNTAGSFIRFFGPCGGGDAIFALDGYMYCADGRVFDQYGVYLRSCSSGVSGGIDVTYLNFGEGDSDFDGDIDLNDYFFFQNCITGPEQNRPIECWNMDFDNDLDVDFKDFAEFQRGFGPAECLSDQDCGDNNPYTYDVCLSPGTPGSACTYYQIRCINGSDCNDNDPYTFDNCLNSGLPNSECAYQPIRCLSDNDCGLDGLIGNPFCVGNDVYQEYVDFTCLNPGQANSSCQSNSSYSLLEQCVNECLNGSCQ